VRQPFAAGDVGAPAGLVREEARPVVRGLYDRFLPVNSDIKALITAWQLSKSQPPTRRQEILRQLTAAHRLALPLLKELEGSVPKMASYRSRLSVAASRIESGDDRYVAGLSVDSYHTIWFELHQDLLTVAGSAAC
jgi:pyruvate,orthophosphate dikinase